MEKQKSRWIDVSTIVTGLVAILHSTKDAVAYAPAPLWHGMRNVERVEFLAGVVLTIVGVVLVLRPRKSAKEQEPSVLSKR